MSYNKLKYANTQVVFTEVPNEISLAINITGCTIHCKGCHSQWLWSNRGKELTDDELTNLIESNKGITTVLFMGGDNFIKQLAELASDIKYHYPNLKIAWYSGRSGLYDSRIKELMTYLDYIKIGPYVKQLGGLDSPSTNQKFYRIDKVPIVVEHPELGTKFKLIDQTYLFQSKEHLV
jgi:anaerobic ribonucleoside-triphosphate reductase activating protein